MRNICKFYKIWIFTCLIIFVTENLSAQLSLKNTNWIGTFSGRKISIGFSGDTLSIKSTSNDKLSTMSFSQRHDTLLIFNSVIGGYKNDTGVYHIFYHHSGQLLSLSKIKESCGYRNEMFLNQFEYIPDKFSAPRDWLQLDPAADSIAGISLYKAYGLLKGIPSKPVVVAVIDNGFDMDHEDLKNVFWANTKEIPANQIDDDKNGYTDDIHGWSFRSNKSGIIIENEQSSATQLYTAWKNKFDNVDTNRLTQSEKKKLLIYSEAKKEYFEKREDKIDTSGLKYSYNVNYNSDDFIGGTVSKNNDYGSPNIRSTPNLSHGTHVAGIIAAKRDNGKGIDGIADNVIIMPIIATTGTGDERDKDIANAIYYAVNNGAQIINMSFSKRFSSDKELVDKALQYAEQKHVLIIHAAGNDGNNDDLTNYYPIPTYENGKKASNFITVGWSRPLFNYRLAHPYSGYGKNSVDLFAPGSDIFSTTPGDSYDYKSGSSMSTPCVSGVAALLLSYFPSLSTEQVKDIILKSVYKPNIMVNKPGSKIMVPFSSLSTSGGIINAYNAVKMALIITKTK